MFGTKSHCLILEAKQKIGKPIEKRNNKLSQVVRVNNLTAPDTDKWETDLESLIFSSSS